MSQAKDPLEMLTVSDENISIEEQLNRKNDGWVISFSLTSKIDSPVGVRISQALPNGPGLLETGFHPKHEPHDWEIQEGELIFEDTVPSDESLVILLGIVTSGADADDLSLHEPTIELSQPVESADESEVFAEDARIFRSSSISADDPSVNDSPTGPDLGGDDQAAADSSSVSSEDSDASSDESSIFAATDTDVDSDETAESVGTTTESPDIADAENTEAPDLAAEDIDGRDVELGEGSLSGLMASADDHNGTDADSEGGESFGDFLAPLSEESMKRQEGEGDASRASSDRAETAPAVGDVVSKLVAQLESSDTNEEAIESLREHLAPESTKSVDVRLEHVQSRMDDLAAYTEALEGFINEHGTASEFMDEIESEFEAVRSDLQALKEDSSAAEEDRDALRERLSGVESSIERLESEFRSHSQEINDRIETIFTRLDDQGSELSSVSAGLDQQRDELTSVRETLDAFDEEFDSVREMVRQNEAEFRDDIEDLWDEVANNEDRLESQQASIDSRLEDLSRDLADMRRSFESELRQLEHNVEELSEMRDVFSQAFTNESTTETADGEANTATDSSDGESADSPEET